MTVDWRKYAPTLHAVPAQREPVPTNETAEVHSGVMVALFPDAETASRLAVEGGEPVEEIHLTLVFLGKGEHLIGHEEQLRQLVEAFAQVHDPLEGEISGVGVFTAGPKPVTFAMPDLPGLPEFRQDLVALLDAGGFPVARTHGYTPHMTLAYRELPGHVVPNLPLRFDSVTVAIGGVRTTYPLGRSLEDVAEQDATSVAPARAEAREPEEIAPTHLTQNAFVTQVADKTIVTAPASALISPEPRRNKHFLTMVGRFVGAERPNRNGAYWTAGDLELGVGTVANGPLNWLHEAKHIIGTISSAQFKDYDAARDEKFDQPYIEATSQIWRYIWPDEASVVEMASDANRLWYSMECISETVVCSGDSGCGFETGYFEYLRGNACQHLIERSSVRHFRNPTFLGGAVIVPPARPGWADADASVKTLITAQAEVAFEQVKPDMTASEWESVMAEVLRFASV